jgi:hypothetical protein
MVVFSQILMPLKVVNAIKAIGHGVGGYEKGKLKLMTTIKIYDQSLVDLTVSLLVGTTIL